MRNENPVKGGGHFTPFTRKLNVVNPVISGDLAGLLAWLAAEYLPIDG